MFRLFYIKEAFSLLLLERQVNTMEIFKDLPVLKEKELSKVSGGSNDRFWTWVGYKFEDWRITSRRAFNLQQRKNPMTHH